MITWYVNALLNPKHGCFCLFRLIAITYLNESIEVVHEREENVGKLFLYPPESGFKCSECFLPRKHLIECILEVSHLFTQTKCMFCIVLVLPDLYLAIFHFFNLQRKDLYMLSCLISRSYNNASIKQMWTTI